MKLLNLIGFSEADEILKFTPESLIAGSVPLSANADPLAVAHHAAAFALDTERIKLVFQRTGDHVHYIAAAAADFVGLATDRPVGTTLAGILARLSDKGRARQALALLDTDDVGTTAVVFADNQLSSFRGYSALVEQELKDRFADVEIVDVSQEPAAIAWHGFRELEHLSARKVQSLSLVMAGAISALALCGLLVVTQGRLGGTQPAIKQANDSIFKSFSDAANQANAPVLSASYTFYELQRLASLTSDSGGRIERFVQDNNRIAWELRLPKWVTQEMLSPLGSDIRVRRDEQSLIVRRGILDRDDESQAAASRAEADMARNASPRPKS